MKCICKNCTQVVNNTIWTETENKYQIKIRQDIQQFLTANSGGFPIKDIIIVDGEEYEVRVFLSLDSNDKNYYIEKPLNYFLENTKGKIVPIGIDSGDNYYCVNNENGKVYYWSSSEDSYYYIAESIDEFASFFR